jgi:hypothetical protein
MRRLRRRRTQPVPHVIHQTWKTTVVPDDCKPFVRSVRDNHPDFEYRLWTDEDNLRFITERFPWFLDTYRAYTHDIERADAIRYFLLYEFGGVYIDIDMEILRPLGELLEIGDLHFSLEAGPAISQTVTSNAFMAARPRHPFFERVTRSLPGLRERDVTFADVFNNTGPDMLDRQVREHANEFDVQIIGLDRICPRGVLEQNPSLAVHELELVRERKLLYAIHHNTETWNVQRSHPTEPIPGYVLFRDHDLPGHDLAYVEVPEGSFEPIVAACNAEPDAVGFNYNGFVKRAGARLEPASEPNAWLKPGISPWVCVKAERVKDVRD